MPTQYHLCGVRSRPEPEIVEVTVPHWAYLRAKRRLEAEGFETVFTVRIFYEREKGRRRG